MSDGASSAPGTTRRQLDLVFSANASGRTWLSQRRVRFPYTIGTPFRLEEGTGRQTLILQTASGGLYGGERVSAAIRLEDGAEASIVTPGATVVHSARDGDHAEQAFSFELGRAAKLAFLPRMNTLLPGARLDLSASVQLSEGAQLLMCEGFSAHRPAGMTGNFDWLRTRLSVRAPDGKLLLRDGSRIAGDELAEGLNRGLTAFGMVLRVAPALTQENRREAAALAEFFDGTANHHVATTLLRGEAGVLVRIAATSGGNLDLAFEKIISYLTEQRFD